MTDASLPLLQVDELLMNVIVKSARDGLAMANLKPVPTGVSKYVHTTREISAIIGCVGATSGSIMLNCSKHAACFMAGKMLGEEFKDLSPETLDSICEIANIIAGQTKAILSTTEYKFDRISVPSIVLGSSYLIRHYKGMQSISVEFEVPEIPFNLENDYSFTISMCLMKV